MAEGKPERSDADKRDAMNRLWASSSPVRANDPVAAWIFRRVGIVTYPKCLRTALRVKYDDDRPSYHPAMIAMMQAPDGEPTILHRTYLTHDGHKADLPEPRRMMPGTIVKGSAVRLMERGRVLGIAEGIETAFAASRLFGVPCWAALNATLLAQWEPPEGVEEVIIFGDNDASFTGQVAAYTLAKRLCNQSRIKVRVEIPSNPGQDWNDLLVAQEDAARKAAE